MKTTEVGGEHGFDGGKKVNGRNRHILVDTLGNVLKGIAHAAHIGKREGATTVLAQLPDELGQRLEKILADGGYAGEAFETWVKNTIEVTVEISLRPPGRNGFVWLPQRWVIDDRRERQRQRTFAWLGRSCRLSKDYEKLSATSEGMVYWTSLHRLLNHLAPVT